MKNLKNKKWILAVAAVFVVAPILTSVEYSYQAFGTDACSSDECKEAKMKADEAEAKSAESLSASQEYELKVKEIAVNIDAQEQKIEATEDKIAELKEEITKTKENLTKKQEALAEMLVNMHFESNKEPIKILASSESISDLAEKASREDTARRQIGSAAEAVRNTKEKLENDKQQVEDLLEDQQETRKELIAIKKEKNDLALKYAADADAFAEEARAARAKQMAEEAAYRASHQSEFLGGYYSTTDGYEYAGRCPQDQDAFIDKWGYYGCECVSYAAWAASRYAGRILYGWGNAYSWDDVARASSGFLVDHNPAPMTVGQTDNGPYGHVFWVESVDADGVNISEYNGIYPGDFYSRKIPFPEAYNYNYIHFV